MKLQILTSSLLALAVLWMTNPLFAQDSGSGTIPAISGGIGADSREALAARTLVNQTTGEGIGQLTFSAGVAAFYGNPASAMRTADEALYLAKRRGKNRVLQSQPGNRSDELDG